jgi:hypothetical protein
VFRGESNGLGSSPALRSVKVERPVSGSKHKLPWVATEEAPTLARGLNKRDFVNFAKGSQAATNAVQGRLTQEVHALPFCELTDFRARFLLQNYLANWIGQIEQLMDGGSTTIACTVTLWTAGSFTERKIFPLLDGFQSAGNEHFVIVFHDSDAVFANYAHQPLRQDAVDGGDEVVCLHPQFKNRPSTSMTLFACTVVKTRWPVSAD